MTKKEITKQLLKDETCDHCKYYFLKACTKTKDAPPTERTCKDFERGTYGRKLNVTWSQQTFENLKEWALNPGAEGELTKAVNEEMKNEIDKVIENDQKRTNKPTKR